MTAVSTASTAKRAHEAAISAVLWGIAPAITATATVTATVTANCGGSDSAWTAPDAGHPVPMASNRQHNRHQPGAGND